METAQVDMDELARHLKSKLRQKELSLRDAADEAMVSAATLSRILRKGKNRPRPDVDTLVKVVRWIGIPIEKVLAVPTSTHPIDRRDTVDQIEVHLRADKNLSPEAAEAIAKMVRVAYQQFAKLPR